MADVGDIGSSALRIISLPWEYKKTIERYYEIAWRNSSLIEPSEFLKDRPYSNYHHIEKEDDVIESLENKMDVLILGRSLSGKTRYAYEVIKKLKEIRDISFLKCTDINEKDFIIPERVTAWRKRIMFIDDLQKFVEQKIFHVVFDKCHKKEIPILATCRSGRDYERVKQKMSERNIYLDGFKKIELKDIKKEKAEEIAETEKKELTKFDGTIGSIFMGLDEIGRRFEKCNGKEKSILRSIKYLYICGIYNGDNIFSLDWIKFVAKKVYEVDMKTYEWDDLLEELKKDDLIKKRKSNDVLIEEAYIEKIVDFESEISDLGVFRKMISILKLEKDKNEMILKLADRAGDYGGFSLKETKLEMKEFAKIAIEAYTELLNLLNYSINKEHYARIQDHLGGAYIMLSHVENIVENCKKAIKSCEEALKVRTYERFPMDYAKTQNNLGFAYIMLAEVENKAENCKKAIKSCEEALKVRTYERFPMDYAKTQSNLGNAYIILAEVENKAENCEKAIKSCEEALKVRTYERFPMDYAKTQSNLGNAYIILAEVENKAENCENAFKAYAEALKVRTYERFPMDYAKTQSNLGNAYIILAEVENKAENCENAFKAYAEALKVRTYERFPIQYAATQNNLGNAYRTLAEVKNKVENYENATKAYKKALKVFKKDKFPECYSKVANNISNLNKELTWILEND